MTKFFLWILGFVFASAQASGQIEKIDTDRPDQTESAVTVPNKYFQVELGFNKENLFGRNYDLIYPTALFKYGFKKFELRLESTYRSSYEHLIPDPKWTSGLDPIEIGFKAAICEEKNWLPKTSVIFHLGLPTVASKPFRADHIAPSFRFTMQHSLSEKIGLGYNLGAEWDGFRSTPVWIYTFVTGIELGEKWYTYLEAFGFVQKSDPAQHNIDGGIAYYINRDVKLDVSTGFGISDTSPKNYYALGISFRVNTKPGNVSHTKTDN